MHIGNTGVVLLSVAVGISIGIVLANAYFVGEDVLRAARALLGFFGAMIGASLGSWFLTLRAEQLRRKLIEARRAAAVPSALR